MQEAAPSRWQAKTLCRPSALSRECWVQMKAEQLRVVCTAQVLPPGM